MTVIRQILEKLKNVKLENLMPFNMLHIAYQDVYGKEVLHSKLLAGLLNPKENHDLGDIPLKTFLKEIEVSYETLSNVNVEIEKNVNGRRIDIFISWKDGNNKKRAVIIENKLHDASDQEEQLNDYYKGIKDDYEIAKIVYLPFNKSSKSFHNTDTCEEVKILCVDFDAKDIVKWLDSIVNENSVILQLYKEFFECLTKTKFTEMKVQEMMEEIDWDDIFKLEEVRKIMNSGSEWCNALFTKQCPHIKKYLQDFQRKNPALKIIFKRFDEENTVELLFTPEQFKIELFIRKNAIMVYLCSFEYLKEPAIFKGRELVRENVYSRYVYYYDSVKSDFSYSEQEELKKYLDILLNELEKNKNKQ